MSELVHLCRVQQSALTAATADPEHSQLSAISWRWPLPRAESCSSLMMDEAAAATGVAYPTRHGTMRDQFLRDLTRFEGM